MLQSQTLPDLNSFRAFAPEEMCARIKRGDRAPATLAERLKIFVMLGRPRTCVPGMLCFALGVAYVDGATVTRTILGGILCFLAGFVANLGNTYADLEEDCRNLPGRVYLMAKLGYRSVLWVTLACYGVMLFVAAWFGWTVFLCMAIGLLLVHEYSFPPVKAKKAPALGLIVFAQVVAMPFFLAPMAAPGSPIYSDLFSGNFTPDVVRFLGMLGFIEVWFVAKGFFKNVPDFYGDRDAGVRTSATIFRTWRGAATVTAVVTVGAYLFLAALIGFGLEQPRVLFALIWLAPVTWNCIRLVRADDGAVGNRCLKTDMVISTGFVATLLFLVAPTFTSVAFVAAGAAVIFLSDLLNVDSRRDSDAGDSNNARLQVSA